MGLLQRVLGLDYAEGEALTGAQRGYLRDHYLNGVFSSAADGATGSYHNLYLLALGASNAQIGLLATLSQATAALAPLPGAWLTERTGAYKASVVAPAVVWRLGILVLLFLPGLPAQAAVAAAIGYFALRNLLMAATGAPWWAMMAQVVPVSIRARYFSARNFAGGLAVMVGTLAVGQVVTALGFPAGYQAVFAAAAVLGMVATVFFVRVPASAYGSLGGGAGQPARPRRSWKAIVAGGLRHGPFMRFTLTACALNFAVTIAGPYIQLYQVRELGFAPVVVGLMASIEMVVNIVMQRVYGARLIPRFGDYRVMRVLRMGTALVPLAWVFVRDPLGGALASVVAGVVWSGHDLAYYNGLLAVTPQESRANDVALHTMATSLAAAFGPALAAVTVDAVGYQALFGASALLRFMAGLLVVLVVRDWARTGVNYGP
jgi:MFS family permease